MAAQETSEVSDAELASATVDGRFAPGGERIPGIGVRVMGRISCCNIQIHGNGLRLDTSEMDRLFERHMVDDRAVRVLGRQRVIDMIVERGR